MISKTKLSFILAPFALLACSLPTEHVESEQSSQTLSSTTVINNISSSVPENTSSTTALISSTVQSSVTADYSSAEISANLINSSELVSSVQFSSESASSSSLVENTFIDSRNGVIYSHVTIGNQTWMKENLNYASADKLSRCYDDKSFNCDTYGRLYSWNTAMSEGICPSGWKLPKAEDWRELADFIKLQENLGGKKDLDKNSGLDWPDVGTYLKADSSLWKNNSGNNKYNLSLLPAGGRGSYAGGPFLYSGQHNNLISSTTSGGNAILFSVHYDTEYFNEYNGGKTGLNSIRCLK